MKEQRTHINGKRITPEDEYRRKLRITARILDHDTELKNTGYGEEMLIAIRKDPIKGMSENKKFTALYNSFKLKPTGYEHELLCLFDKYDDLLKNCKSDAERRAIGSLGVIAISRLLDDEEVGIGGSLSIDGRVVSDQLIKN